MSTERRRQMIEPGQPGLPIARYVRRWDRAGRPLAFIVTGGEVSDSKQLVPPIETVLDIPSPKDVLADAGYDGDANRNELLAHDKARDQAQSNAQKNTAYYNQI